MADPLGIAPDSYSVDRHQRQIPVFIDYSQSQATLGLYYSQATHVLNAVTDSTVVTATRFAASDLAVVSEVAVLC